MKHYALCVLASISAVCAEAPVPETPAATVPEIAPIGVEKYGKRASDVLAQYAPTVAAAHFSTAKVFNKSNGKQVAMATVVSASGYLISKASELENVELEVLFAKSSVSPGGLRMSAKVVDTCRSFDLALLKVEASGLNAATFMDCPPPVPGTFLTAADTDEMPLAFGVASVNARSLDESNKGFLGVMLRSTDDGLKIGMVTEKSAAAEAGLKVNDIVLKVNGRIVATVEEFIHTVGSCKPTERVQLQIKRADELKDVDAILRARGEFPQAMQRFEDPRNSMSGALSNHRTGFPAALQHDLFLKPSECGGPLTDLDGHIVGINIAHSGRTESLAIPSASLAILLKTIETGKFFHPEIDELRKSKVNLEEEMKRLDEMEARLKGQIDEIAKKLQSLVGE